ncbi:hypothetical protein D0862_11263 [Hortaea werneckii]|uniref:DUF7728 domain-containing protein n=1 Tax=Hortaea werneckii TaxID=91943 RepID=A0A3M7F8B9_HORWE|nr:hypothetical protein D0862_11263 [Hortaea werneckii]
MIGRAVGITAACALGASALILPPGIAPEHREQLSDLSTTIHDPKNQIHTIPCSECAFPDASERVDDAAQEDDQFWIQGGAKNLVLNFTVSEDGKSLQMNGGNIYPPTFQQDGVFEQQPVYVKQVPAKSGLLDIKANKLSRSAELEVTAYGVKEGEKQAISPNGDMLVPVNLDIFGLENQFMHSLDEVALNLLLTGDGELLIMSVDSNPASDTSPHGLGFLPIPPPPRPHRNYDDVDSFPLPGPPGHFHGPPPHKMHDFEPKECTMLPEPLCKLTSMIESKIDSVMAHHGPPHGFRKGGCHGRKGPKQMPGHIRPHFMRPGQKDDEGNMEPHHGRPHHGRPHGMHHGPHPHHHHHHGHGHFKAHFVHAFAKGLVAVLIPVMVGITVGMFVSLVGLVVGRLIGYLWIQLARGGRRGSVNNAQREIVLEEGEDRAMIAEIEGEAPPQYEDSPAYEDVVGEKKGGD